MILHAVKAAQLRLKPYLSETALVYSSELSQTYRTPIYLKLELEHPTRAFKVRPAFNSILTQLDAIRARGVLTTSSGNFAQAVAYAAKTLGVNATVVMTDDANPRKVQNTRDLGAEVVFCGLTFESRFAKVAQLQAERNSVVIHPFDSEATLHGDGTVALELLKQFPAKEEFAVLCPASGGGLVAGIGATLKESLAPARVFAVQPENGGAFSRSLQCDQTISTPKVKTCADALMATHPGTLPLEIGRNCLDGAFLISESDIFRATQTLNDLGVPAEPGGAIAVAAIPAYLQKNAPTPILCIISGGNSDPALAQTLREFKSRQQ